MNNELRDATAPLMRSAEQIKKVMSIEKPKKVETAPEVEKKSEFKEDLDFVVNKTMLKDLFKRVEFQDSRIDELTKMLNEKIDVNYKDQQKHNKFFMDSTDSI